MITIREFITGWNHRKNPFIWTEPAEDILPKIERKREHVSTTAHRWLSASSVRSRPATRSRTTASAATSTAAPVLTEPH